MLKRHWLTVVVLLVLIGIWQAVASLPGMDLTLASPVQTVRAMVDDRGLLFHNAWITLTEVLLGLAIAVAVGAATAIGMHLARPLRDAVYPLLIASQAMPVVVLAPLLVLALDFGMGPKLTVVALVCFFPVTVNLLDGLRSVDPELLKLMRSLRASRLATLWKVELPSALPYLFSGLRVAATVSVIGAVFGEWAEAQDGLGHVVLLAVNQLLTPRVWAGVTILMAMSLALFLLVTVAERFAVPWNRRETRA
jgi:ABC-type nitrate/sulfonate/bicarbonate transport system permease component